MNCQKFKENLYLYMDNEIDSNLRVEADEHIENCPICALELDKEKGFDKLVRHHVIKEEAPFELRESIVNQINKPKRWFSLSSLDWIKQPFAVPVLSICLALVVVSIFSTVNKPFPVFAASINSHKEMLKGSYPTEIESNDLNEVLEWFNGKFDFAISRPHLDMERVQLVGGRIAHLEDRKVAYFIFKKDNHYISAFYVDLNGTELPKVADQDVIVNNKDAAVYAKTMNGFTNLFCHHKSKNSGCSLVSDMPQDQLVSLMR